MPFNSSRGTEYGERETKVGSTSRHQEGGQRGQEETHSRPLAEGHAHGAGQGRREGGEESASGGVIAECNEGNNF